MQLQKCWSQSLTALRHPTAQISTYFTPWNAIAPILVSQLCSKSYCSVQLTFQPDQQRILALTLVVHRRPYRGPQEHTLLGQMLTFLKLDSASVGFSRYTWKFISKAMGSQILVFQHDSGFWLVFKACHDKPMCTLLTCSMCVLMFGSKCGWGLGEGSNFQLVRWPWVLRHFQAAGAVWLKLLLKVA